MNGKSINIMVRDALSEVLGRNPIGLEPSVLRKMLDQHAMEKKGKEKNGDPSPLADGIAPSGRLIGLNRRLFTTAHWGYAEAIEALERLKPFEGREAAELEKIASLKYLLKEDTRNILREFVKEEGPAAEKVQTLIDSIGRDLKDLLEYLNYESCYVDNEDEENAVIDYCIFSDYTKKLINCWSSYKEDMAKYSLSIDLNRLRIYISCLGGSVGELHNRLEEIGIRLIEQETAVIPLESQGNTLTLKALVEKMEFLSVRGVLLSEEGRLGASALHSHALELSTIMTAVNQKVRAAKEKLKQGKLLQKWEAILVDIEKQLAGIDGAVEKVHCITDKLSPHCSGARQSNS